MDESIRQREPKKERLLEELYQAAQELSACNAAELDYSRELPKRLEAKKKYLKALEAACEAGLKFDLGGYLL